MSEKLAEERTWTCAQLGEAVAERYGVKIGPEGIRKRLKVLGYSQVRGKAPGPSGLLRRPSRTLQPPAKTRYPTSEGLDQQAFKTS